MATPSHEGRLARQLRPQAAPVTDLQWSQAVGHLRVSTGVLALPRAASPIRYPRDHPLVGSRLGWSAKYSRYALSEGLPHCVLRDGVVNRELPDCHAPELERSSLSRRILTPEGRTPRWDVSEVSRTLSEIFMTLAIPVEEHFRRWHHPGRCPGGGQQPPYPPDHLIASAAWRPKSPQTSQVIIGS